jgi:dTDP-4-amino-4,6-dideoxygalactose transaminase
VKTTVAPPEIPIARPLLGEEEVRAAERVIRSGWVMQGTEVADFERELAGFVGGACACAVSSGTAALHLALRALDVGPGDEVVTVSHSFIATANVIAVCGARPVFVDIESEGFNIDPAAVEAALSPRTRAILCVHQLGMPCDLAALVEIAARHRVPLLEDAACALGSEIDFDGAWERVGRPRGALACFSFHPRKLITTGEGGMVVTADAALDARVRRLRQHGAASADRPVDEPGLNYRLTDIQAAIGRVQLARLPSLVMERRRLATRYRERLAGLELELPGEPVWARSNWQSYCVLLPERVAPSTAMQELAARGIAARRGVGNAHEEPAYASARASLPRSERARRQGLCLPMVPGMTVDEQERVVAGMRALLM